MHNLTEASRKFKATRPIKAAKTVRFKPYEMPDKLVPLINVNKPCNWMKCNFDPTGAIHFLYFLSTRGKQN